MSEFVKAGVIGHPISHSKSPIIHNYWIKQHGLNGSYEAIDLSCEGFTDGIKRLLDDGYRGFNLTIPHKETGMGICDDIDHAAQNIGAVNTITVKDGKVLGSNTDAFGFLTNITQNVQDFDYAGKTSVVLGAGGAARAVVSGLISRRIGQIILCNRTREKAENLAHSMNLGTDLIDVRNWDARSVVLDKADLLVNTTAMGMKGAPALEIDISKLKQGAVVNDIVYAPLETDLLKAAQARGYTAVTGIGMLLHQARPAFQSWFGVMPEVDADLEMLVMG